MRRQRISYRAGMKFNVSLVEVSKDVRQPQILSPKPKGKGDPKSKARNLAHFSDHMSYCLNSLRGYIYIYEIIWGSIIRVTKGKLGF